MAKKLSSLAATALLFDAGRGPLFEVRQLSKGKILGHARGGFHRAAAGARKALNLPPGRLVLRQIG